MKPCKSDEVGKANDRCKVASITSKSETDYFQLCYLKLKKSSPPVYVSLPSCISCHRCGSVMRLGIRKYKVQGAVRELQAYRCGKKGCQTFRSPQTLLYPKPSRNGEIARNVKKITLEKNQHYVDEEEKKYAQSLLFPWLKVSRYSATFKLRIVKFLSSGAVR